MGTLHIIVYPDKARPAFRDVMTYKDTRAAVSLAGSCSDEFRAELGSATVSAG